MTYTDAELALTKRELLAKADRMASTPVGKDFGASADPMPGGQSVTLAADPRDDPGHPRVRIHESTLDPGGLSENGIERHLACSRCGCEFAVSEGESALKRKQALQAGVTEDPNAVSGALKGLNRASGHDRLS